MVASVDGPNLGGARMLRAYVLAVALPSVTIPGGVAEQSKTSSWSSEKMRLTPRPRPVLPSLPGDELGGNCAGLTVTIRTRIERLKALQEKARQALATGQIKEIGLHVDR